MWFLCKFNSLIINEVENKIYKNKCHAKYIEILQN